MDHRLKALIEVRNLLESEGWAPDKAIAAFPSIEPVSKSAFKPNLILTVISLAAIATNFVLIGANHDLRAAKVAILSVLYVRDLDPNRPGQHIDIDPEATFVTLNGEWVWGAKPGGEFGRSVHWGKPGSPPIEIEGRSILQVWEKGREGKARLICQTAVSSDHPSGSAFEVRIFILSPENEQSGLKKYSGTVVVGLKIVKGQK